MEKRKTYGPRGATAKLEKLIELDLRHSIINRKSHTKLQPDLTRALETIWDLFFDHAPLTSTIPIQPVTALTS